MGNRTAGARGARAWLAFIALVLFTEPAFVLAQNTTFHVSGRVTATDETPIAGASVVLTAPGVSKRARSDARGKFKFHHVTAGTYSLRVTAAGYEPLADRTVTIDQLNATLTVVLSRATTNSLSVIGQVRASAGETVSTSSAPTLSLPAQSAAAAGVTSVASMLYPQLSVTPVLPLGGGSNATVAYAVRGPDPTETLVDIDGHKLNNGTTGSFDLSLLDPAALQDVQVIYGISPSSLIGPNSIGGGLNIVTLEPTATPHSLMRFFGGSYGSFGETLQTTGTMDRLGYAVSLHGTTSSGSVNQTILAPPPPLAPPSNNETLQSVGSYSQSDSMLTKLRYQLGGPSGYGYVQLNFRDQTVVKDDSALLTTYVPPGFAASGGYQSFSGTMLAAHQANYGIDAQFALGNQQIDGAPANVLLFSHLTTLDSQSVSGPGAQTLPYLYNQRDLLGDDWLELDHRFPSGVLSFKYDIGTENLTTNYVQGQVTAQVITIGRLSPPPVQTLSLSQTQRYGVLRYTGDLGSAIHYAAALYDSDFSTFGSSFDPRVGLVWTPTGNTAVSASVGTTFQTPQLSELVVPPPQDRVPVGGIIFIGNPNLKPDRATDYDIGAEQIFNPGGHALHVGMDLYQNNVRSQSSQLNVTPIPNCQTKRNPTPCPLSYPVNAGDAIYRGIDLHAEQELAPGTRLRAGWDVDSSFLTVIPAAIQDGTFVAGQQSLGQPLHKAYLEFERQPPTGLGFGARLNYEGTYNELNRSPYATLDAQLVYRHAGYEYGLYGTNLTNVYSTPFTIVGGGVAYGALPGQPITLTNAYVLQGASVVVVFTKTI